MPKKKTPTKPKKTTHRVLQPMDLLPEERDFAHWLSKDSAVLDYFSGSKDGVHQELWVTLEDLRQRKGKSFYVELLYALTHKFFKAPVAKRLWESIVRHKRDLAHKLKREVGIKVAVLDYLDYQSGKLKDLQLLPGSDLDNLLLFANEDGLTGLYNHRYFQERLRHEIIRSLRYHHEFSLLFVDLDHFKQFNDSHGHLKGDIMLREIAHGLQNACRQSDVVARYGGDEFAVILPETNNEQALILAERLNDFLLRPSGKSSPLGPNDELTVSIGLSTFPANGETATALIGAADKALYRAKRSGRDCVAVGQRILRCHQKAKAQKRRSRQT